MTGPSRAALLFAAGLAGAGTMTVELAAVRLVAPWFGTSQTVWTQVIGVILLGLSVGYLAGGRWSRRPSGGRMALLLGVAALWTAVLPLAARFVAGGFVPEGLSLEEAVGVLRWGSLASALLLFLVPAVLLGTIAPQVVESLSQTGLDAGRAGGWVLSVGTIGSLVGVWGTSEVLIPLGGVTWTFRIAACALAAGAIVLALGSRRIASAAAAFVAVPVGLLVPALATVPAEGWTLLAERSSRMQDVRVLEAPASMGSFRTLQVNEAYDSYQSVWFPEPGWLPEGYYYNDVALPYFWSAEPKRWRVLILGLGGGTAARVLEGVLDDSVELEVRGVELDPVVVELACEYMDLDPSIVISGRDARSALRQLGGDWDLIYLDCYANQIEIPPHLSTVEFLSEVRDALAPSGWVAANVGGFGLDDPIVEAIANTLAHALERDVVGLRVPHARNVSLFGRRAGALPVESGGDRVHDVPRALQSRLGSRELAGMARRFEALDPPLTDAHAPTERLQRRSLEHAQAKREAR